MKQFFHGLRLGQLAAVLVAGIAGLVLGCDRDAGDQRSAAPAPPRLELTDQVSGIAERIQAVDAVDDRVVWVSGVGGQFARTVDGGVTWVAGRVPGTEDLEFRDVHALDAETAWLLAAGPGAKSRVYRTDDGGQTWRLQVQAQEPEAFWDCFDFWDAENGLLFGDSIAGVHQVLRTADGGATWVTVSGLPPARMGEGGFAASGTCLVTAGRGAAWIVTGAGDPGRARVLLTADRGETWQAIETPLASGEGRGLMSVVLEGDVEGDVVRVFGGDLGDPEGQHEAAARSADGGQTWEVAARPSFAGAVYGAAFAPRRDRASAAGLLVAVGPGGAAVSSDAGVSWQTLTNASTWSVDFGSGSYGWMVGPEGRITRIRVGPPPA